jgi:hypothetical protein
MRRVWFLSVALCVAAVGVSLCGCTKKAASSTEAIEASKALQSAGQKVDYLINQAKAFYNSKDFQQAIDISQYILAYVDKNSTEAKSLLEKAKADLSAMGQKKLDELKGKIGSFGK